MSKHISISHFNAKARQSAEEIVKLVHETNGHKYVHIKLYGVPRGGVTVAYAIAAVSDVFIVVQTPEEADVIIDDLIDSGKTRDSVMQHYPDKIFHAMFGKPDEWLVFPWEGTETQSADDIPLRLLQYIGEDYGRGGLKETPERFLKAWKHFTSGYGKNPNDILKVFDDGAEQYDEMVLVKNIPVYSQCEHHLVPFFGVAHVAYIPDGKIVGLSKLSRIVDIYARRLQVQERLTNQVAQAIQDNLSPLGVAVVIECRHLCMESRGICQQGHTTVTSSMHGAFRTDSSARTEFLTLIKD